MTTETWFNSRKRSLKRWLCKALDKDRKGYVNLTDLIAGIISLIILGAISFLIGLVVILALLGLPLALGGNIFTFLGFTIPDTIGTNDAILYWILGLGGLTASWYGIGAIVKSLKEINKRTPDVKIPQREFVLLRCDRDEWTKTEEIIEKGVDSCIDEAIEESGN